MKTFMAADLSNMLVLVRAAVKSFDAAVFLLTLA